MFHRIATMVGAMALLLLVLRSANESSAESSSIAGGQLMYLRNLRSEPSPTLFTPAGEPVGEDEDEDESDEDQDESDISTRHGKTPHNLDPHDYLSPRDPIYVTPNNASTSSSPVGLGAMLGIAGAVVAAIGGVVVAAKRLRKEDEEEGEEEVDANEKGIVPPAKKAMDFSNIVVEEESIEGDGDQSTVLESSMDVSHEESLPRPVETTALGGSVLADAEDEYKADNELVFDKPTENV